MGRGQAHDPGLDKESSMEFAWAVSVGLPLLLWVQSLPSMPGNLQGPKFTLFARSPNPQCLPAANLHPLKDSFNYLPT